MINNSMIAFNLKFINVINNMFTNDSILLREYFFPRITFKNSVEFQKLYDHFQSIQKSPLNVTRFKESNMKGKVKIKSDYGSQKILDQSYLFKKSLTVITLFSIFAIITS